MTPLGSLTTCDVLIYNNFGGDTTRNLRIFIYAATATKSAEIMHCKKQLVERVAQSRKKRRKDLTAIMLLSVEYFASVSRSVTICCHKTLLDTCSGVCRTNNLAHMSSSSRQGQQLRGGSSRSRQLRFVMN